MASAASGIASIVEAWRHRKKQDGLYKIDLPSGEAVTLTDAQVHQIVSQIERVDETTLPTEVPAVVGGIALSDTDQFFRKARARIDLVFRIRLAVALLIAVILVVALGGAIIGLATGNVALAAGLGATTVADLIGAGVYKPLDKIRQTLVDTQRLDLIHLMAKEQLAAIQDQDPQQRLASLERIWKEILSQVATLESSSQ